MSHHHAHGGHGEGDTTGVHGMLLFGEEQLYLSHLPMFESPHNFQVLLEVGFDDPVRETLRSDREGGPDRMYTFVPETFPIVELDPGGEGPARTSIEGTIFRGHFERGGEPIAEGAVADVQNVVVFHQLDTGEKRAEDRTLSYLCLGEPGQVHLAHEITAKPDFDHVLTAQFVPETVTDMAGRRIAEPLTEKFFGDRVEFQGRKDTPGDRLVPGETVRGVLGGTIAPGGFHGFAAQVEAREDVYLEIDELS
jgi:hypothetical protein